MMPELPDVEVFRRDVHKAVKKKIDRITILDRRILRDVSDRTVRKKLEGTRFAGTDRIGKFLFLPTEGSTAAVVHFGMSGYPAWFDKKEDPPRYARVVLTLEGKKNLAFCWKRMLGRFSLADSIDSYRSKQHLGPDAMTLDKKAFREALSSSHKPVKALLMDQSTISGLGNIYADEVLFQSGIHPATPSDSLSQKEAQKMFTTMHRVIETSVRHRANPDELPESYLIRHRSEGASCPKCGGTVKKRRFSGRSSYFCPKCQKKQE
jgi:formamidopyrimidine-DNA glycosylase